MKVKCRICPHGCALSEGETGLCGARRSIGGEVKCINYGKITSMSLDPIEKKPFYHFFPGSMILSVGSFGCNFNCGFCQNHSISMAREGGVNCASITPGELAQKAAECADMGNIGVAYTYNEPLIGFEFVLDSAREVRKKEMKNALVTNGYICEEPLLELLPFVDAVNIDLKSIKQEFYEKIGGGLDTVLNTIKLARRFCHVEITTLIIPDENDSEEEIIELSKRLADIDKGMPLHISRFFPRHEYKSKLPTEFEKIHRLADIAKKYLPHVYTGNC
ncbi:MAG: AmmeMemoRadiSam system radical SAM enzyme [Oscillospiraceae bacterium]|nr:AmmeMemoRadiSam system radical SAM enzyme [Oscillospiraceae bacterium]